jgi:hypothetical protein
VRLMTSTSNEPPIMFPAINYEKNYTKPPPSISPSQEAIKGHKEGDDKPGVVWVVRPGMDSVDSLGVVQEDDLLDEVNEAEHGEIQQTLAGDQDLTDAVAIEDDEHDNKFLAAAIEYEDPDSKPSLYKNRRFRVYMGVGCCILLMAIVMAIVGTTVLGDDGDVILETNEPTSAPTMSPTTTERGRNSAFFAEHVSELVLTPDTSHDLALQWIMDEDPLQLDINSTRILQRYMMVFFYYSTSNNGNAQWRSCGPAVEGEDDSCVLLEFTRQDDNSIAYVEKPGKARWLSGTHECEWEGILCLGGDNVLGIHIRE